ncbi:MAG TPA: sulfur carrier protein ThiS [Dehalococcoidia bacterium]|nr:sulfur carrier protein ThiS [Dehalococcoidia bacterium]
MPRIEIKLYAMLRDRLPPGSRGVTGHLDVASATTVADVLKALAVPPELCQVVVLNDEELDPERRDATPLQDGDRLSVFPPIAGGARSPGGGAPSDETD